MKERMKVHFAQLPVPTLEEIRTFQNFPLGPDFMMVSTHKAVFEKFIDCRIASTAILDRLGDEALIDMIFLEQPNILAMACYSWNIVC